jgi:hypothetical protein
VDTEGIRTTLQELLDNLHYLSFFFHNWRRGIDQAGAEYVLVALRVSKGLFRRESGLIREYEQWLACYGSVYTATPYQVVHLPCQAEAEYLRLQHRLAKIQEQFLPEPLKEIQKHIAE